MKKAVFILFLILTAANILFASWSVLHGDLNWISDVARDMFLRKEIAEKGLVLIGPRASGNLFHGNLWSYVTFPGYLLGNGNPVVVGWYWIFLTIVFLFLSYFMVKKLFNKGSAMLYVLTMSLYMTFHANEMIHPYGAVFTLPFFFYFFVRYQKTFRIRYLIVHLILAAAIVQFEIAIGIPLVILSAIGIIYLALKNGYPKHLLALLIIPLLLSNFFIFDLRHEFIISKNAIRHLGTASPDTNINILIQDRLETILTKFEFLRFGPPNGQLYGMLILLAFTFLQIKNKKFSNVYLAFLYFFFGFYALSLFNRYRLLGFYVYPIISLVFLIFSSFITSRYKKLFLIIFMLFYSLNLVGLYNYVQGLNKFIGKNQYSWKALYEAASTIYRGKESEFGYLIYSPDILGYGPRYAMEYAGTVYKKSGYSFAKKPVTYLLIEPPAPNNSFTSEQIWKWNAIHIYKQPVEIKKFANGYKIEKYLLFDEELTVGVDPNINPGLFYR